MKQIISKVVAFLAVLIILGSCSASNEVVSGKGIVKRKYRNGYYVQSFPLFGIKSHILKAAPYEKYVKKPDDCNEAIRLTASVGSSIALADNKNTAACNPASKLAGTIKSIKHLYEPDITDITVLRYEFKKIKNDLRDSLTSSVKCGDDTRYSLSILSFICGSTGLFFAGIILGALAIILGTFALAKKKKGRLLAIIGIVLGIASVVLVLIILYA